MSEFFLDPQVTFLNHGSYGACTKTVLLEQRSYQNRMETQPVQFMVDFLPKALNVARSIAAKFVGTTEDNITFVKNATTGVNAVLKNLKLSENDEVLTTNHRYDAVGHALVHYTTQMKAKLVVAQVPFPIVDDNQIVDAITQKITKQTKLLVVDQISSATATLFPIEKLANIARSKGILILVDGAHSPGQIDLNLDTANIDFWTGNMHKWICAPKGSALLYVNPKHHKNFHAPIISHGYQQGFHEEYDWMGTDDFTAHLSTPKALALHKQWGGASFRQQNHNLMCEASDLILQAFPYFKTTPQQPTLAMRSFLIPDNPHAREIYNNLWKRHKIEVVLHPWGNHTILRISCFSRYNTMQNYQRLVAALQEEKLVRPAGTK